MRWSFLWRIPLTLAACLACVGATAQESPCAPKSPKQDIVAAVDERLELTLESGTRLRLAGVEPPRATTTNPRIALEARDRLAAWLTGRTIDYASLSPAPDRWGRLAALAAAPVAPDGPSMSVARAVIDAGLARAAPDAAIRPCVAELLRHEGAARREALGVWADPVFTVLRGDNRAAFTGRGGEIVVVEGLVTGVGETQARTWLNFGPIRTVDFAVTIGRQGLKNFATAGLQPRALEGKSLRVRGLLDVRFGPQIDLVEPSAVEILTQDPAPPQSRPVARR